MSYHDLSSFVVLLLYKFLPKQPYYSQFQPSGDILLFLPFSPRTPLFKGPLLASNLNICNILHLANPLAILHHLCHFCHFCQSCHFRQNCHSPSGIQCESPAVCWFSRFSPLHAFLDKSGKLFQTMLLHPSAQYSTLIIFTLVPADLPLVVLYYHLVSLGFHYCDLFQIPRIQQESSKHLQFIFDEFEYDREITQWNVFVTDFKRDRAMCPL